MSFDRFMQLPTEMKDEILKKCCPIVYPRLQQTCKLVNEICVKNRKRQGIVTHRRGNYLRIASFTANVIYEFSIEMTQNTAVICYPYPHSSGELNGNRIISSCRLYKLILDVVYMCHGTVVPKDIRTMLLGFTKERINKKRLTKKAYISLMFSDTLDQFLDKIIDVLHTSAIG